VLRGGSWIGVGRHVRSAGRDRDVPSGRYRSVGLRLARGRTASKPSGGAGQSKQGKKPGFFKGLFKK
jgi:hypothetical protein